MDVVNKVNIGSDIKLTVHLNTKYLAPLNIHSVQAYLVNTTIKSELEKQIRIAKSEYSNALADKADNIQFISRFPKEPHFKGYISSHYDICQCGYPHYHSCPCHHRPVYPGFGVHPHTFDGFRNHLWAHYDLCPLIDKIKLAEEQYDKSKEFLSYQALVEETANANTILVYFPGEKQLDLGVYKLILVAKVYQPGYSKFTKLKTIVVDYDNAFELVESGGGDANIQVGVAPTDSAMTDGQQYTITDRFIEAGEYDDEGHINIKYNDQTYAQMPINIESETEWWDDERE